MTVTLLAMARAGEVYLSRDERGVVRRHDRYAPGEPLEVHVSDVTRAVELHDYLQVDEDFQSWAALEMVVEERVPTTYIDPDTLVIGPRLAQRAPGLLTQWLADERRRAMVPVVIGRLLEQPFVSQDAELSRRLIALLRQTQPRPVQKLAHLSPRTVQFHEYFEAESAAA